LQHQIPTGKILKLIRVHKMLLILIDYSYSDKLLFVIILFRSVCDRFDVGKTAWRSVRRVVNALVNLREHYIKWPTEQEASKSATCFEQKKGFPGIIGAIDGTHIKIEAPQEN